MEITKKSTDNEKRSVYLICMSVSLLGKYYVTNETGINDTYKIYTMDINEYK
jgi:hypothetical protein